MRVFILTIAALFFVATAPAYASEVEGTVNTGVTTGVGGTIITSPSASPVPATYTSVQSVTLTASPSDTIRYTIDATVPTCSEGAVYTSTIAVGTSQTIRAVACRNGTASAVSIFAYTITIPAPTSSGGGGGGGSSSSSSSGGSGGESASAETTTTTSSPVATTDTNKGRVLGESIYFFAKNIRSGAQGADVIALQEFLRTEGLFTASTNTGHFGPLTLAAVKAYQAKNGLPVTGFVGEMTRAKLNAGSSSSGDATTATADASAVTPASLTEQQKQELIALLQAQLRQAIAMLAELLQKQGQ